MPKIPYERIAPEANKLIMKMTAAPDLETADYYWDAYVSLLEAAGWDTASFDRESAKRVEEGWDDTKPIVWN
jgi:hypothetical protein